VAVPTSVRLSPAEALSPNKLRLAVNGGTVSWPLRVCVVRSALPLNRLPAGTLSDWFSLCAVIVPLTSQLSNGTIASGVVVVVVGVVVVVVVGVVVVVVGVVVVVVVVDAWIGMVASTTPLGAVQSIGNGPIFAPVLVVAPTEATRPLPVATSAVVNAGLESRVIDMLLALALAVPAASVNVPVAGTVADRPSPLTSGKGPNGIGGVARFALVSDEPVISKGTCVTVPEAVTAPRNVNAPTKFDGTVNAVVRFVNVTASPGATDAGASPLISTPNAAGTFKNPGAAKHDNVVVTSNGVTPDAALDDAGDATAISPAANTAAGNNAANHRQNTPLLITHALSARCIQRVTRQHGPPYHTVRYGARRVTGAAKSVVSYCRSA